MSARRQRARPLPHQLLWQARQIADAHSLMVVEVQDEKRDRKTGDKKLVVAYVVYRRCPYRARNERLGKRTDPREVLDLVRTAAGLKDERQDEQPAAADARR